MEVIGEVILAILGVIVAYFFGTKSGARKNQEKVIAALEEYHVKTKKLYEKHNGLANHLDDLAVLDRVFSGKAFQSVSSKPAPTDEGSKDGDV